MVIINVITLQNEIVANPEHIITILQRLGYKDVEDRGKPYIQCRNADGDNPTAVSVLKSTLQYNNYTRNRSGNIFTLVQEDLGCKFPEALKKIAKWINLKDVNYIIRKPFGGFYENMISEYNNPEDTLKVVSESQLPSATNLSPLWVKDNVSLQTMEKWGIRLDLESNKIIIPWYDYLGNICGAKMRSNDADCPMDKRWGMYIPFPKSLCVYGWWQNYNYIIKKKIVIVVEAEKSVLQAYEFGCFLFVAIGGHNISETQAKYIKSLNADLIVVAFDEGVCEAEIKYEASKLIVNNLIYKNRVEYIYDRDNKYLKSGSKDSPTDNGLDIWMKLYKEYRYKLKGDDTINGE